MPQSCILRCSVQTIHLYVKMLLWQKGLVIYSLIAGSNLTFQKASQKKKASSSSISVSAFSATSFMWVLSASLSHPAFTGNGQHSREKKKQGQRGAELLSCSLCYCVIHIWCDQLTETYCLRALPHVTLPKYDESIRSFVFFLFSYTVRINFSIANCTAIKE